MKADVLLRACIAIRCRDVGTPEKRLCVFVARMPSPFERKALTFAHLCVYDMLDDLAGLFHWGWKEGRQLPSTSLIPEKRQKPNVTTADIYQHINELTSTRSPRAKHRWEMYHVYRKRTHVRWNAANLGWRTAVYRKDYGDRSFSNSADRCTLGRCLPTG